MTPRESDVVANGLRHRVLEWNSAGARTVVLLHGFLDLAWSWQPVAPSLAEAGLRVIAPDLRGFGDSEAVGAGGYYHFVDYVFDVADLVDALAPGQPVLLVGHSMGGGVAATFAGAFPERVSRLALLEGLGVLDEPTDHTPKRVGEWIASVRKARGRSPRVYASVEEAAARLRQVDPRCGVEQSLFLAEKGTREVAGGGRAFKHDPLHVTRGPTPFQLGMMRSFWSSVRCPVLLVEGSESEYGHLPDLEGRRACFADGRRVVIEGAGHMMVRHRPEAVTRALVEFLTAG